MVRGREKGRIIDDAYRCTEKVKTSTLIEIWSIEMAFHKVGSRADEVKRIQERLKILNFYKGPIDGDFGGGTEAAVKAFQKEKGLTIDGLVGRITWNALFKEEIPEPVIFAKPP